MLYSVVRDNRPLVENVRHKHVAWVNGILSAKGWSQTELARKAGLDPSTLSRFLRDVNPGARLNTYTIERLEQASGIPAFETELPSAPRGLAEGEAEPWVANDNNDPSSVAIRAIKGFKNHIVPWILRSNALETAGYLSGDVLFVDLNETASLGDIVCAQVYDRVGRAETVFRIYEKPYLVAASLDNKLRRPILMDDERAQIRGVVIASFRPRTTH